MNGGWRFPAVLVRFRSRHQISRSKINSGRWRRRCVCEAIQELSPDLADWILHHSIARRPSVFFSFILAENYGLPSIILNELAIYSSLWFEGIGAFRPHSSCADWVLVSTTYWVSKIKSCQLEDPFPRHHSHPTTHPAIYLVFPITTPFSWPQSTSKSAHWTSEFTTETGVQFIGKQHQKEVIARATKKGLSIRITVYRPTWWELKRFVMEICSKNGTCRI